MTKAATCVAMCQPSANKAIECSFRPPMISTAIMVAVRARTRRVFFSAPVQASGKSWRCCQLEIFVVCIMFRV